MIADDDPRHGSTRGYAAGCRCKSCRAARATRERNRRKRHDILGERLMLSALGSQRRICALQALGWRQSDIAEAGGWADGKAIDNLMKRKLVINRTAQRVDDVYRKLQATPGPSEQTRRYAKKHNWAAPLAWNDIDNDAAPTGMRGKAERAQIDEFMVDLVCGGYRRAGLTVVDRRAVVVRLHGRGLSLVDIAIRCGVSPEVISQDLKRAS